MRITRWAEYGVHIAAYLGWREQMGDFAIGGAQIAESQGIACDYTQQILQRLRDGGLVKSVRGPNGGYALARPASEISLFDIVSAAEGEPFEVICEAKPLSSGRCGPSASCGLRPVWYRLRENLNSFLQGESLAQIVEEQYTKALESPLVELPTSGQRQMQVSTRGA